MTQHYPTALAAGAALLALLGCSSSPVSLSLAETPIVPAVSGIVTTPHAVQIIMAPTIDVRPAYQRTGVGHIGGREVVARELLVWIDRSLQTLHGYHYTVRPDGDAQAWHVTPRLRQFYTASVAVSKNANVVLELEIQAPGNAALTRIYRGRVNAVNWWNSAREIEDSVVEALRDCLSRIGKDLDALVQMEPATVEAKPPTSN